MTGIASVRMGLLDKDIVTALWGAEYTGQELSWLGTALTPD